MKEKQSIASKLYLVIFLLSLILLFYNIPLGCLGVLLCGICFWRDSQEEKQSDLRLQKAIETIYGDIDRLNQERMYELPIALVIVNEDGQICWYNQYFDRNFKKKDTTANFFGKKIQEELGIDLETLLKEKEQDFNHRDIDYTIVSNSFSDGDETLILLHFFDVTIQKKQQEIYKENEPVFCYILIDNYDDIIEQLRCRRKAHLAIL